MSSSYQSILKAIQDSTPAGQKPALLIAVSKGQPTEKIEALYRLGQRDFGENYVQELLSKNKELALKNLPGIRWHFLGHLQKNKSKLLVPVVDTIHSLDSLALAEVVARDFRSLRGPSAQLPVFLQVNIDREKSKSGFDPDETVQAAEEVSKIAGIHLLGLMCIPAEGRGQNAFARLRELEKACRPHTHGNLSMGMSSDFEAAIQEGSTHVRVGTAIFGERS